MRERLDGERRMGHSLTRAGGLFVAIFLSLTGALVSTPLSAGGVRGAIEANKDVPGAGVLNPVEWAKDYVEDQFKDALVGSEISEGMDAIFKQVFEHFNAEAGGLMGRPKYPRCKNAAFTQAFQVAADHKDKAMISGFFHSIWDIEKKLITLGGAETLGEWLKETAEDQVRKAIGDYMSGQKPEVYEYSHTTGEGCDITMKAVWNKPGGRYEILYAGDCHCNDVRVANFDTRTIKLKEWAVVARGTIQVVTSGDKLTFRVSRPSLTISANCDCVAGGTGTWVPPPPPPPTDGGTTTTGGGALIGGGGTTTTTGGGTTTTGGGDSSTTTGGGGGTTTGGGGTTTPPPQPPPLPPPQPEWSMDNPCPPCQAFLDAAREHQRKAAEFDKEAARLREQIAQNEARQKAARDRIDQKNKELGGQEGTGGSATDPDTGLTTESWTQADGRVKITVRDASGKVIEERFRDRRDSSKIREEIAAEERRLQDLQNEAERLRKDLDYNERGARTQRKLADDALNALRDCIREKCGVALAGEPEKVFCVTPNCGAVCETDRCESTCTGPGCEAVCAGSECQSSCIGEGCETACVGVACDSFCAGDDCQTACTGTGCEALCTGPGCQSACDGGDCPTTCTPGTPGCEEHLEPGDVGYTPPPETSCPPCEDKEKAIRSLTTALRGSEAVLELIDYNLRMIAKKLEQLNNAAQEASQAGFPLDEDALDSRISLLQSQDSNQFLGSSTIHDIDRTKRQIETLRKELEECEKQCTMVEVEQHFHLFGNDPFDAVDPIAPEAGQSGEPTGPSGGGVSPPAGGGGGGATTAVINNIPIERLFLAAPDACPAEHFHGNANNCNGVFTFDPDPSGCGHGTVSAVTTIPVSACPDL